MLNRVKALREKTGAAMQDCKKALEYADEYEDQRLALAYLRSKAFAVNTGKMPFDERTRGFMDVDELDESWWKNES